MSEVSAFLCRISQEIADDALTVIDQAFSVDFFERDGALFGRVACNDSCRFVITIAYDRGIIEAQHWQSSEHASRELYSDEIEALREAARSLGFID